MKCSILLKLTVKFLNLGCRKKILWKHGRLVLIYSNVHNSLFHSEHLYTYLTSHFRGIDVVRNKIKMFAQQKVTLPKGRHKVIILDEADRYALVYRDVDIQKFVQMSVPAHYDVGQVQCSWHLQLCDYKFHKIICKQKFLEHKQNFIFESWSDNFVPKNCLIVISTEIVTYACTLVLSHSFIKITGRYVYVEFCQSR